MFSFTRLRGADPTLGVEMHSTGEVACFGHDVQEAYLQALLASTFQLPQKSPNKYILVSIAEDKIRFEFEEALNMLMTLGFQIVATPGTATYYSQRGLQNIIALEKPTEEQRNQNSSNSNTTDDSPATPLSSFSDDSVLTWIRDKRIDLVINIPDGTTRNDEVTSGYLIRRTAVDFGTSLITNVK